MAASKPSCLVSLLTSRPDIRATLELNLSPDFCSTKFEKHTREQPSDSSQAVTVSVRLQVRPSTERLGGLAAILFLKLPKAFPFQQPPRGRVSSLQAEHFTGNPVSLERPGLEPLLRAPPTSTIRPERR